jgi:hypothetical protein
LIYISYNNSDWLKKYSLKNFLSQSKLLFLEKEINLGAIKKYVFHFVPLLVTTIDQNGRCSRQKIIE